MVVSGSPRNTPPPRPRAYLLGDHARAVDISVDQLDRNSWRLTAVAGDLSPVTAYLLVGDDGALLADPGSAVTWPEMLGAVANLREKLDIKWVFGHSATPSVLGALPLIETTLGPHVRVVTSPDLLPVLSHYGTRLPIQLLRRGEQLDLGGRMFTAEFHDHGDHTLLLSEDASGLVIGDETGLSVAPLALPSRLEAVRRNVEDVLLTTLAPIALEGRALAAFAPVGRVTTLRTYVHDEGTWWELGGRGGMRGKALHQPPPPTPATYRVTLSEPQPVIIDLRFALECAALVDSPEVIALIESLRRPLISSMRRMLSMRASLIAERRLRVDSRTDPLTGVANRRAFAEWESKGQFAALMIDLDRFKSINDGYGHAAGDDVLRRVASAIGKQIRSRDLLVRYGGDEFLLLLAGADNEVAEMVAHRVRESVAALSVSPVGGSQRTALTMSIGISCGIGAVVDVTGLADQALYAAKQAGRDCVRFSP